MIPTDVVGLILVVTHGLLLVAIILSLLLEKLYRRPPLRRTGNDTWVVRNGRWVDADEVPERPPR